jgi:hypothetical protein
MMAQPLEQFETVEARHFQIGDQDARQRESRAIGKLSFALEVRDDVLAAADNQHGIGNAGCF